MRTSSPSVFFTGDIFRLQRFGGVSRYILELHRQFKEMGIHSVLGATGSQSQMLSGGDGQDWPLPAFGSSKLGRLTNELLGAAHDHFLSKQLQGNSVVHRSYYGPNLKFSQPTVCTLHDLISKHYPTFGQDSRTKYLRSTVNRSTRIITVSLHSKLDIIETLGVASERIDVIHHGVRVDPPLHSEPSALVLPKDFALFVGHRAGYKNWGLLIQALSLSPINGALPLICFGGPPPSVTELREIAEAGFSTSHVRFLSGSDRDLDTVYRKASVLVYPSLYEGFGLPPLEAMARGCPVVSSIATSLPEVVGDAGILVDCTQPELLALAITDAMGQSRKLQLMEAGFARANTFTWERTALQTLESYQKALS